MKEILASNEVTDPRDFFVVEIVIDNTKTLLYRASSQNTSLAQQQSRSKRKTEPRGGAVL